MCGCYLFFSFKLTINVDLCFALSFIVSPPVTLIIKKSAMSIKLCLINRMKIGRAWKMFLSQEKNETRCFFFLINI